MQPLKPSSVTSTGSCTNPIGSKCVIWDGPEITCLDGTKICKGQTIEVAVYQLATKLCEVLEAINIQSYSSTCLPLPAPSGTTIKDVATYIIDNVCNLYDQVEQISSQGCPTPTAEIPTCIATFSSSFTNCQPLQNIVGGTVIPVDQYAALMAGIVCCLLSEITSLQNQVDIVKVQIDQLWAALADCNKDNEPVQPTCTYDYTADPSGGPVALKTAYEWLEAAFCQLQSAVGTPAQITTAISKECANLENQERLSSGGVMSGISGWVNNPTTLADSVGNLWLTVCDMRQALAQVLTTCCFSICDYLEFGYSANWDIDGNYVELTFGGTGNTLYTEATASSSHSATWGGSGAPPAWVTSNFPPTFQTNVIISLSDGSNVVTIDTGNIINNLVQSTIATPYVIDFTTPQFAGYDKMSPDQTITFNFSYVVNDGATPVPADCDIAPLTTGICCAVDFTEGFLYECDSPAVSPCNVEVTYPSYDALRISWNGLVRDTQQYFPALPAVDFPVTSSTNNTLVATPAPAWTPNNVYQNKFVYVINGTTNEVQCRRITASNSNTLTVSPNWDVNPTNADTFYITNDYVPLPFNKAGGPPFISRITNYELNIYDASVYDPNDSSTWVPVLTQEISLNLNTVSTVIYQTPAGELQGNTEYVVTVQAIYPCGPSAITTVTAKTPIQVNVSLEQVGNDQPLTTAFGTVTNILSNTVIPNVANYTINNFSLISFPIELPNTLGDSQFNFYPRAASLTVGSSLNSFCGCGLDANPSQTDTSEPDYRDAILGIYRGYTVGIYQFDPATNNETLIDDQSIPPGPYPYETNSVVDPSITFNVPPTPNVPIPPLIQIPVNWPSPVFWIKAKYDPNILVNQNTNAYTITFDNTSNINITNRPMLNPNNMFIQAVNGGFLQLETWDWTGTTYFPPGGSPTNFVQFPFWYDIPTTFQIGPNANSDLPYFWITPPNLSIQATFGQAIVLRAVAAPGQNYAYRLREVNGGAFYGINAGSTPAQPRGLITATQLVSSTSGTCYNITKNSFISQSTFFEPGNAEVDFDIFPGVLAAFVVTDSYKIKLNFYLSGFRN